jgi:mannose-6-phosphate isomerase-like protein (cupin superfamily)/5-methylcytosine-specific restriction endonuclease McrA
MVGRGNGRGVPKLTIECEYCQSPFVVPCGQWERRFCSKSCASKARPRERSKLRHSACAICKNRFEHYGNRICCGITCHATYMSQNRIGDANPAWKPKQTTECKNCGEEFSYGRDGLPAGETPQYCSRKCWDLYQKGKNRSLDGPATYTTPYPVEFSRRLRRHIRKRDDYCCVLCGVSKKGQGLPVHHIDYDKGNNDEANLISLCARCHGLTNFCRGFWQTLFTGVVSSSKIVKKGWGAEVHLVNSPDYCLKMLVFFAGKKFSHHYHELKKEMWFCLMGELELVLEPSVECKTRSRFTAGSKIEIAPGVAHQLFANKNSIVVEVSTRHFPEDSIRLVRGD